MSDKFDDLKPCPFCGGKAGFVGTEIECIDCGMMMPKTQTFEGQIRNWNTRPLEDALRAELAALKEVQTWIPIRLTERFVPEDAPVEVRYGRDGRATHYRKPPEVNHE